MKINIVYATILGTSQMAEDLEDALSEDHEVDVQDIMQVSPDSDLGGDAFYVFISSTTGHGDMPDLDHRFRQVGQ